MKPCRFACRLRCRVAGRFRAAGGNDAALTASDAGARAARHRGSHPAAAACTAGTPQQLPHRPRTEWWNEGPSARSSGPRPWSSYATSRPSSGDLQLTAQRRERSLRSLYCCSDGVRGRGAPMTYLSHTASFHSNERIAPSNPGIKHVGKCANCEPNATSVALPHVLLRVGPLALKLRLLSPQQIPPCCRNQSACH